MNWIGWTILIAIALLFLVIAYAALNEERRKRALWDEYWHPPDSEVKDDDEQH